MDAPSTNNLDNVFSFHSDDVKMSRKHLMILICTVVFVNCIVVADISSVKVFKTSIFGLGVLIPGGTLPFALTFLATDVICEIERARVTAWRLVWTSVLLRLLTILFFVYTVGDNKGSAWPFTVPPFWNAQSQASYKFVLSGTIPIYAAGFAAIIISSVNDIYLFSYLREKHQGKNLYWLRNGLSTTASQIINSTIFVTIAYAASLTIHEILSAILGQCIAKFSLAWADTPLAYTMRNFGQGRKNWANVFSSNFWRG